MYKPATQLSKPPPTIFAPVVLLLSVRLLRYQQNDHTFSIERCRLEMEQLERDGRAVLREAEGGVFWGAVLLVFLTFQLSR